MPSFDNNQPAFSASFRSSFLDGLQKNPHQHFKILIIGGGIVGAGVARELALGGAEDVLLVEKNDFASGTSGASSKLIHAGIRYLEQFWNELKSGHPLQAFQRLSFVWEASRERKILGRLAPHLVKPKKIYFVVGKGDERTVFSVILGVWFYYFLQLLQGQFFTIPEIFTSPSTIKKKFSGLNGESVKGVLSFWDSETEDAALTIDTLSYAFSKGIKAVNYTEAVEARREGKGWTVRLMDRISGKEAEIRADYIVNASGPFLDKTASLFQPQGPARMLDRVAGGHIDVYPCPVDLSYYITASDGRLVFILKRREGSLVYARIGTTERPLNQDESSDSPKISEQEENYLRGLVSSFFPDFPFNEENQLRLDEGIRALALHPSKENAFEKSREHRLVWGEGVVHVAGVKLTDFRRVAEEIVSHKVFRGFCRSRPGKSRRVPIEARGPESDPFNQNIADTVHRTMVVKWEDLFERRLGLMPRVMAKTQKESLKREFDSLRKEMNWSEEDFRDFPPRR